MRSWEPVAPIRFSRWVCRACVALDVVVLALLLAGLLGWGPNAGVVAIVLLVVLVGAAVVLVRLSPTMKLAYPSEFVARFGGAPTPESVVGERREGWSSWSIPKRAEVVERARAFREMTAVLERGEPVAPLDREAAGVHAYRMVATYTQGAATSSLLVAGGVLQLLQHGSSLWPWFGAALLVGAAVLLVFNLRRAGRWQRIAEDRELVEFPGDR